ncbi:MAG: TIGR00282 family metallophosphoesterase [Planctomycetes bacterium]|nr:TIGR00282 family metallophosphoesterase [Planctomycetota bacterium]
MIFRILCLGDVVGRPGRDVMKKHLPALLKNEQVDFCIVNAENAAGGSGIIPEIFNELMSYGIQCVTTGDHIWKKKEIIPVIEKDQRLLRPANYPLEAAGRGFAVYDTAKGIQVAVLNLQGRVFMKPIDCPFKTADDILEQIPASVRIIICDFHAEATSEKVAMGWYLDGRVSFVFGTHTHIQTADETILPQGTAYITDLGMTGPYESVIGRRVDKVLHTLITSMPTTFDVAEGDVRISGAIAAIDAATGKAIEIKRIVVKN